MPLANFSKLSKKLNLNPVQTLSKLYTTSKQCLCMLSALHIYTMWSATSLSASKSYNTQQVCKINTENDENLHKSAG